MLEKSARQRSAPSAVTRHGDDQPSTASIEPPFAGGSCSSMGTLELWCPVRNNLMDGNWRILAISATELLTGGCLISTPFEPLIEYSMLLWPPQTHTSPNKTSRMADSDAPDRATRVRGVNDAGTAGRVAVHTYG